MARDVLTDHSYDGIQEYDNPCPGWWHALFLGTFVFSFFYFVFFQFSTDRWTMSDAFDAAMARNMRLQFAEIGTLTPDEPTIAKYMHDTRWLTVGQGVFKANCVSCHGADGQGLVGPNLTDDNYKNVTKLADIATIIMDGANKGAMPAWKNRLHPNEVTLVSAYVAAMRGKNLPGYSIEGEKPIPPWPAVDTTADAAKSDPGSASAKP